MSSNEALKEYIIDWIKVDNEMAKHRSEMKTLRARHNDLTASISKIIKSTEIDGKPSGGIAISGGSLFLKVKQTRRLTKKSILDACDEFYKDTADKETIIQALTEIIMDKRVVSETEKLAVKMD